MMISGQRNRLTLIARIPLKMLFGAWGAFCHLWFPSGPGRGTETERDARAIETRRVPTSESWTRGPRWRSHVRAHWPNRSRMHAHALTRTIKPENLEPRLRRRWRRHARGVDFRFKAEVNFEASSRRRQRQRGSGSGRLFRESREIRRLQFLCSNLNYIYSAKKFDYYFKFT